MSCEYTVVDVINAFVKASKAFEGHKEEINRLNVFPVPDGDTGTNMWLTFESVVSNLSTLTLDATPGAIAKAITTGALMGARGNSGVITSQILRGMCEGALQSSEVSAATIDVAFSHSVEVAFQAVRKPVEGTILTVLRDSANAAKRARKKKMSVEDTLAYIVDETYASVEHTPELLPVLKENGVVDAGGYGLAIFFDAFDTALTGREGPMHEELAVVGNTAPKVEIEEIDDWEGSEYRYCTEFLVHSDDIDLDAAKAFLPTMGDCDLMVGMHPNFKVHVHSNRPDQVLAWFLDHDAQISEVHVHNMDLQTAARSEALVADQQKEPVAEHKPLGFIAVAAGEGNANILESLGVDIVVAGGQTMNPSTKDLLDAIERVNADAAIILPNNKNIVMAAQSACDLANIPCAVVPTNSVPEAFAALFGANLDASLEENVEAMTDAFSEVHTGEVTTAIKDAKDADGNSIHEGDVIGIADDAIKVVGSAVDEVVMDLLNALEAADADSLIILAGEDMADDNFDALVGRIEDAFEDLEVDAHRGDQPLYPIVLSVE